MRHHGSIDDLRMILTRCGLVLTEERPMHDGYRLGTPSGLRVVWSARTGRLALTGKASEKAALAAAWDGYRGPRRVADIAGYDPAAEPGADPGARGR